MQSVESLSDISGKRVFLRAGLNVPIQNGNVLSDFRIKKALPTIKFLLEKNAKVVIASHIGSDGSQTLEPVFQRLRKYIPDISFVSDPRIDTALISETKEMSPGRVMLLENIRRDPREVANDLSFAKELASLCDVYVNDAFSVSHREHASIVGVPRIVSGYGGVLLSNEVKNLERVLKPEKPFYVIFGGAKISTKLPLVERFLPIADKIFLYGALAHDVLAARGFEVGASLREPTCDVSHIAHDEKIALPLDVIGEGRRGHFEKKAEQVEKEDIILDAGHESISYIEKEIKHAKTILWNGPVGDYEKGYSAGTEQLAHIISENSAFSVVGGGDTIGAIEKLSLFDSFGFVSTGGGAMLRFLAHGTLPGIEALK